MGRQNQRKIRKTYRISLFDNDTHKSLFTLKFSKPGIILVLATTVVVFVGLIFCIIAFTPVRTAIPGYPDANSRKVALRNAIKIDSLESSITRWELYAENLSRVLSGDTPITYDSIIRKDAIKYLSSKPQEELQKQDSLLRETIHKEEQFRVSSSTKTEMPVEGMHFFCPLRGVIVKEFDRVLHPGLDISAPGNTVISSIYEGTVIYSGWDDEKGYMTIIQHPGNLLSIYEHCEKLLLKVGDGVKAGTAIALAGNPSPKTVDNYMHFAIWYNGVPQDPTKYISF